jgi:hypothetical protein
LTTTLTTTGLTEARPTGRGRRRVCGEIFEHVAAKAGDQKRSEAIRPPAPGQPGRDDALDPVRRRTVGE